MPPGPGAAVEDQLAYPGWRVVAAANLGVMVSFGSLLVFTFGIFLKPLAVEFNWSREEISRAFAIAAMTVASSSPFLGYALDRFGPRAVVLPCFAAFGAAILALSQLSGDLWQLYAIYFILGLTGNGTTQMGFSGAVSSWFDRRRGLALAIVIAGAGLGSIVHPVLAERLIASYGWRVAYIVFGLLVLSFGIPLTAMWLRVNPSASGRSAQISGSTTSAALRQREFWILVAVLFLSSISVNGALTHLAAHLNDSGMSTSIAALAVGILGVSNLCGRLLTGWLLDRISGPRLSFWLLVAMALGLAILSRAASVPLAILAVVLIGVGLGGEADITPFLISRYFGLLSFSTLYGLTWTFYALAGAIGPLLFGRVFDTTGSYSMLLQLAGAVTAVSAFLMLAMRPYRRT